MNGLPIKTHFLMLALCLIPLGAFASPISLEEAAQLIKTESKGVISLNSDPEDLYFTEHDNILTPIKILAPEYVQALFKTDVLRFISLENSTNFLDAKENYFRGLDYSFSKKYYLQKQTTLSDWGGLNHPPMFKIQPKDMDWITQASGSVRDGIKDTSAFHNKIDLLSDSELTSGNRFDPFLDKDVLPRITSLVNRTKKTLWASALLFSCDESTKPLVDALIERAKDGVDVRLLVDKTLQSMQKMNCRKIFADNGIKLILVPGMIFKGSAMHVKLWMSDFHEGIFLGANLIDIQVQATGFNFLFHDSGMNVVGPAVTDMAKRFLDIWNIYSKSSNKIDPLVSKAISDMQEKERADGLRGQEQYSRWFSLPRNDRPDGLCRVVTQERHSVRDRVSKTVGEYIKAAQDRIWFSSVRRDFHKTFDHPEIGYNELLINTFNKAKNEGVRVEMMFNAAVNPYSVYSVPNTGLPARKFGLKDKLMQAMLNRSTDKALREGAEFFEKTHKETPLFRSWSYFSYSHMKNMMIDDDVVITGSYNPLDERSTNDAEIAIFCQDKELNKKYSLSFARDLVNSIPYPYSSQITK